MPNAAGKISVREDGNPALLSNLVVPACTWDPAFPEVSSRLWQLNQNALFRINRLWNGHTALFTSLTGVNQLIARFA